MLCVLQRSYFQISSHSEVPGRREIGGGASIFNPLHLPCNLGSVTIQVMQSPDVRARSLRDRAQQSSPHTNPHWAHTASTEQNFAGLKPLRLQAWFVTAAEPSLAWPLLQASCPHPAIQTLFTSPGLTGSVFIWVQLLLKSPFRWLFLSVPGISPRALLGLDMTVCEVSCFPWGVSWGFADNIAVFSTGLRGQCSG